VQRWLGRLAGDGGGTSIPLLTREGGGGPRAKPRVRNPLPGFGRLLLIGVSIHPGFESLTAHQGNSATPQEGAGFEAVRKRDPEAGGGVREGLPSPAVDAGSFEYTRACGVSCVGAARRWP